MSRWIDADALHEALMTKQKWVVRCGDKHNEGYTYDQVHFAIDEAPTIEAVSIDDYRSMENTCYKLQKALYDMADRKTENSSEKPNNCEHITEDGVTCAKYPACDDCLDNPLNKVKGSERLVKGSEQTEPTGYNLSPVDKDINVRSKTEPQTETEIAKAIVHKMIDNSVIAEDAYPDLRQRMHKAVERLDEYYPSEDERSE